MYDGTYNRTCEAIELQHELFQIDEVAELLGQLTCKQVKMLANTQYMSAGTYNIQISPSRSMLDKASALRFEKTATSAGIVPPNLLPASLSSSSFVSDESNLIVS